MFTIAKHIFAAAAVILAVAAPPSALAKTVPSSGSRPAVSEITVTKTIDAASATFFR